MLGVKGGSDDVRTALSPIEGLKQTIPSFEIIHKTLSEQR